MKSRKRKNECIVMRRQSAPATLFDFFRSTPKPQLDDDTSKPQFEDNTAKSQRNKDSAKPQYNNDYPKPELDDDTPKPELDDDTPKPHKRRPCRQNKEEISSSSSSGSSSQMSKTRSGSLCSHQHGHTNFTPSSLFLNPSLFSNKIADEKNSTETNHPTSKSTKEKMQSNGQKTTEGDQKRLSALPCHKSTVASTKRRLTPSVLSTPSALLISSGSKIGFGASSMKIPLTSFKQLEPLLFNKLDNEQNHYKHLESRFWEPSGDGTKRPPIEVSQGPWLVEQKPNKTTDVPPLYCKILQPSEKTAAYDERLSQSIPEVLKNHLCIKDLEAAFDVFETKLIVSSLKEEFNVLEDKAGRELCKIFRLCERAQNMIVEIEKNNGTIEGIEKEANVIKSRVVPNEIKRLIPTCTSLIAGEIDQLKRSIVRQELHRSSRSNYTVSEVLGNSQIQNLFETLIDKKNEIKMKQDQARCERLDALYNINIKSFPWMKGRLVKIAPLAIGRHATVWDAVDLESCNRVNVWIYKLLIRNEFDYDNVTYWISQLNQNILELSKHRHGSAKSSSITDTLFGSENDCSKSINTQSIPELGHVIQADSPKSSTLLCARRDVYNGSDSYKINEKSTRPSIRSIRTSRRHRSGEHTIVAVEDSSSSSEEDDSYENPLCMTDFDCLNENRYEILLRAIQQSASKHTKMTIRTSILVPKHIDLKISRGDEIAELIITTRWAKGRSLETQLKEFGSLDIVTAIMLLIYWERHNPCMILPIVPSRVLLNGRRVFVASCLTSCYTTTTFNPKFVCTDNIAIMQSDTISDFPSTSMKFLPKWAFNFITDNNKVLRGRHQTISSLNPLYEDKTDSIAATSILHSYLLIRLLRIMVDANPDKEKFEYSNIITYLEEMELTLKFDEDSFDYNYKCLVTPQILLDHPLLKIYDDEVNASSGLLIHPDPSTHFII